MTESSESDPAHAASLLSVARQARGRSYAPYSGFTMGAAVRTANDGVFPGSLVENVSLGLAMCAERVALFSAVAAGERPTELALVSKRTAGKLTWPCGACLQVALELGGESVVVTASDLDGEQMSRPLSELLPCGPRTRDSGV